MTSKTLLAVAVSMMPAVVRRLFTVVGSGLALLIAAATGCSSGEEVGAPGKTSPARLADGTQQSGGSSSSSSASAGGGVATGLPSEVSPVGTRATDPEMMAFESRVAADGLSNVTVVPCTMAGGSCLAAPDCPRGVGSIGSDKYSCGGSRRVCCFSACGAEAETIECCNADHTYAPRPTCTDGKFSCAGGTTMVPIGTCIP